MVLWCYYVICSFLFWLFKAHHLIHGIFNKIQRLTKDVRPPQPLYLSLCGSLHNLMHWSSFAAAGQSLWALHAERGGEWEAAGGMELKGMESIFSIWDIKFKCHSLYRELRVCWFPKPTLDARSKSASWSLLCMELHPWNMCCLNLFGWREYLLCQMDCRLLLFCTGFEGLQVPRDTCEWLYTHRRSISHNPAPKRTQEETVVIHGNLCWNTYAKHNEFSCKIKESYSIHL